MTVMRDSLGQEVPKSAFVIRATELQMFLNCPRQWYILSHNGLNMEPAITAPKLRFGTIWHKAMEHYYAPGIRDQDRLEAGLEGLKAGINEGKEKLRLELGDGMYTHEFQELLQRDEDLLRALLDGYPQWANHEARPSDLLLEPVSTEQRFLVPILTPSRNKSRAYLAVRMDAVVKDNLGHYWIVEHKTRGASSKVDDPQGLVLDMQMGLQLLALNRVLGKSNSDYNLRGVIYNLVRRQKPGPRVRSPIYGRHQVTRTPSELAFLEDTLYRAYREMLEVRRTMNRHTHSFSHGLSQVRYNPQVWSGGYCTWGCPALNVCEAAVRGDDVDYLLSTEFRTRDKDIWQMLEEEMND